MQLYCKLCHIDKRQSPGKLPTPKTALSSLPVNSINVQECVIPCELQIFVSSRFWLNWITRIVGDKRPV